MFVCVVMAEAKKKLQKELQALQDARELKELEARIEHEKALAQSSAAVIAPPLALASSVIASPPVIVPPPIAPPVITPHALVPDSVQESGTPPSRIHRSFLAASAAARLSFVAAEFDSYSSVVGKPVLRCSI